MKVVALFLEVVEQGKQLGEGVTVVTTGGVMDASGGG